MFDSLNVAKHLVTCTLYRFCEYSKEVTLTTGVAFEPTHWKQTALWLEPGNCSSVKTGDSIHGLLTYKRSTHNARDYSIKLTWTVCENDSGDVLQAERSQTFKLAS